MIYFLLAAVFSFLLSAVVLGFRALLPLALRSRAAEIALISLVVVGIGVESRFDGWLLETEVGARSILGAMFGYLVAILAIGLSRPDNTRIVAKGADASPASGPVTESTANTDPWWVRSSSLIPLALLALLALALVAPRGELSFGYLRSVKTPVVEAQFVETHSVRNQADLRLEIESEPQGFFVLDRRGLWEALAVANADVHYYHVIGEGSQAPVDSQKMANEAREFISKVLQPAALCVKQVDGLYGDREILGDLLHGIGEGLARALIFCRETPPKPEKARSALTTTLAGGMGVRSEDLDVLDVTLGSGHHCAQSGFELSGERYTPPAEGFCDLLLQPSVVYAASMFFLWSGNPQAAEKLLACNGSDELRQSDHPAISHACGFTRRWLDSGSDPAEYLGRWNKGIQELEQRLKRLEGSEEGASIRRCKSHEMQVVELTAYNSGSNASTYMDFPELCNEMSLSGKQCSAGIAYGYYSFFAQKLRNHLVYESARELMKGRRIRHRERILEQARQHADRLETFAREQGLRCGHCFTRQKLRLKHGLFDATTSNPERDCALYLDAIGLLAFARGLELNGKDNEAAGKAIEHSLKLFQRSLAEGEGRLEYAIRSTILDHRSQARRALDLPDY
jgi:hypothetical protein